MKCDIELNQKVTGKTKTHPYDGVVDQIPSLLGQRQ